MQANNKSDVAQVYESATRATKTGIKDSFKYILKPLSIFSYHYFLEGIRAVQKDGPTKELEKITNLSYDETIRIMEKCQKDAVRVVASERKLAKTEVEFGKNKSLYQQKRITKYARRIKQISEFKANYPKLSEGLYLDKLMKKYMDKQKSQIEQHKNKYYNIYFNKSKITYMTDRIAELVEYRTGISQKLFNEEIQSAISEVKKEGMNLNSQQLKDLANKFKLHEIGEVEISDFKKDYCIHELPLSTFLSIQDELEVANIPYGIKTNSDNEENKTAKIYFENKHLERYSELGFNTFGNMRVYGNDNVNMQWDINSQEDILSFKTKVGDEERQTYSILSGKNYIMKREENECLWTIFKADLKELVEKEKKRDIVDEDLARLNIFEQLEKQVNNIPNMTEGIKEIEVNFENELEER